LHPKKSPVNIGAKMALQCRNEFYKEKMDIIDYAQHLIKIEQLLRETHDLCNDKKINEAQRLCLNIIVEARLLQSCLTIMGEKTTK